MVVVETHTGEDTKITVTNYLRQDDRRVVKTSKSLRKFHDLLMDMASQFEKAYSLGMRPRAARKPNKTGDGTSKENVAEGKEPKGP